MGFMHERRAALRVDNESHINVRLQARADSGASACEPLFGGT
jgi:hypothetical protein